MDLRDIASDMQRFKKLARLLNSRVEADLLQLAQALNEAITQSTRASGRDAVLMKCSMQVEAELKQLKDYAGTLAVFAENRNLILELGRMGDIVTNVKVHLRR
jgi:hypothetical protein